MKQRRSFPALTSVFLAAGLFGTICQGAVVSNSVVNADSTHFDPFISTSLVTDGQSSLAGVTASPPQAGFTISGLNDAKAFSSGEGDTWYYATQGTMPATITFTLNGGYDISTIASLAGWGDGDSGAFFGSQQFALSLEIGGSGTFVDYGNFGHSAFLGADISNSSFSTLTTITSDSGPIASNVTAIRFVYSDPYPGLPLPNGNGTVIREISVLGVKSVPEPASYGLAGLGLVALMLRRRRA